MCYLCFLFCTSCKKNIVLSINFIKFYVNKNIFNYVGIHMFLVVYFGQCCAHSLRPQAHIAAELAAASCVVCWRHLHQRVPSQLGSFSLTEGLFPSETSLQTSATVPVIDSNSNSTVAHLRLTLTLGRGKLHYGGKSTRFYFPLQLVFITKIKLNFRLYEYCIMCLAVGKSRNFLQLWEKARI